MTEDAACRILVFDFKSRHLQSLDLKDLQLFRYAANNILCELSQPLFRAIDAHHSRCDMSLTLLSQNLLISPAYLSSIFKKIKGISINQYLTQSRLDKARELLSGTSLTLTEIADRVGYNDLFYFSKVFKRYFGVAPSAYKPPAH